MEIKLTLNTGEIGDEFDKAITKALESCGLTGEAYAKLGCPVDTGALRNSITHVVDDSERKVGIGTNQNYAAYVELGSGIYYAGGRTTPWSYQDDKGVWHRTSGQRPQPFLKPALEDHVSTYKEIIESALHG